MGAGVRRVVQVFFVFALALLLAILAGAFLSPAVQQGITGSQWSVETGVQ